ncbi:hypothetical protein ACFO4O_06100 [Glaciecola siphonariae]|uniref:GH16 domain-containing protein n=1 Tax=Glaciecola siphonariae TaxID=521012 RepID=A0ABV9LV47_9ALTE
MVKNTRYLPAKITFSIILLCLSLLGYSYSPKAHSANPLIVSSDGVDRIASNHYTSPAWKSDEFVGQANRVLDNNKLVININHSAGGYDAGLTHEYPVTLVDDVSAKFAVDGSFTSRGETSKGHWWYGPKASVNWPHEGKWELDQWYENYVVDIASKNPDEMHTWLMHDWDPNNPQNEYLGTTRHNGSVYKHYKFYFNSWVQFWAVRQNYRNEGRTNMAPILQKWREHGLPNKRIDDVKFNVETHGAHNLEFVIFANCLPDSFKSDKCN